MMKTLYDLIEHLDKRIKLFKNDGSYTASNVASILEDEVKALRIEYRQILDTMKFKITAQTYDSHMETVCDYSISVTQLENATLVQPLAELRADELNEFATIITKEMGANYKSPILLVPFDVKVLKITGLIPTDTE